MIISIRRAPSASRCPVLPAQVKDALRKLVSPSRMPGSTLSVFISMVTFCLLSLSPPSSTTIFDKWKDGTVLLVVHGMLAAVLPARLGPSMSSPTPFPRLLPKYLRPRTSVVGPLTTRGQLRTYIVGQAPCKTVEPHLLKTTVPKRPQRPRPLSAQPASQTRARLNIQEIDSAPAKPAIRGHFGKQIEQAKPSKT